MIKILNATILDRMHETAVVPVFYDKDPEICRRVFSTAYDAGIRVFEFTNRGEEALENFQHLAAMAEEMEGMILGIGTIFTRKDAVHFLEAGARFVVSPALIDEVALFGKENDLLWVPGCGTVTEIYRAQQLGASLVKIFPGNVLGAEFVKAVKAVLPQLRLMPTGGVSPTEENLTSWFRAGVHCVGMGSQLFDTTLIRNGNFEALGTQIREALLLAQSIRK